ncbi:helix-turn-helix domain-containing protein [bacterium]|nr:MAG: helix-turn-helix domain-containing protein [bacterium]
MADSSWLSLSEASKRLGIHFTTLRRWADQGLIEHMRTPGGKRKFSTRAIDEFLERRSTPVQNPKAIEVLKDKTLVQARTDIQNYKQTKPGWYANISDEQRKLMRATGNKLIALMFQYCSRENEGEIFLEEGKRIGKVYGRFSASVGLTLEECIRTFLFFSQSMLGSMHETGALQGMADNNSQRLFQRMNYFLDEVMVGMVLEFSQAETS